MKYENPNMEIELFDLDDIVITSLIDDGDEGTKIPGLPGVPGTGI